MKKWMALFCVLIMTTGCDNVVKANQSSVKSDEYKLPEFEFIGDPNGYGADLYVEDEPFYPNQWDEYLVIQDKQTRLYGFMDYNGNVIVEPKWKRAAGFHEGIGSVQDDNGKWVCIDKTGEIVLDPKSEAGLHFSEGLASVRIDGKCFFINKKGEMVIEPGDWDYADIFVKGFSIIWKIDNQRLKQGVIDKRGKVIAEPIYDSFIDFSEGLATVELNGKTGVIDTSGNLVIDYVWDSIGEFVNGLAPAEKNGQWVFIDKTGKVALDTVWDYAESFQDGFALVSKDGKHGHIDYNGKLLAGLTWSDVGSFHEGYAIVVHLLSGQPILPKKAGFFDTTGTGFIDTTGKLVCEAKWDFAKPFSEGYAAVKIDSGEGGVDRGDGLLAYPNNEFLYGDWGFIDTQGNLVVDDVWYNVYSFRNGVAIVDQKEEDGTITRRYLKMKDSQTSTTNSDASSGKPVRLSYNGKLLATTDAYAADNRTMIPVRFITEELGCKVLWDGKTQTVTIQAPSNKTIELQIGSKIMRVNGKEITMDTTAIASNGKTFVPVKFIAEAMGLHVDWNNKTNTVELKSN